MRRRIIVIGVLVHVMPTSLEASAPPARKDGDPRINFTLHLPWPELPRGYVVFRLSPSEHRHLARIWRKQTRSTRATGRMRLTLGWMSAPPARWDRVRSVGFKPSIRPTRSRKLAGLGISYRRAWLLVDDMNNGSRNLVISVRPGGVHGGGATLTPFGQKRVERYCAIESDAMDATRRHLSDLELSLKGSAVQRGAAH
jgi:molybdate transport repressor ModE-like protein